DEGAAVTEAVGDQSARDPVLFGNDFVVEVGADAENRAQAGIAGDRIKSVLVGAEIVVDEPCRTASIAYTLPLRRALSENVPHAGLAFRLPSRDGARINVDCTRPISASPCSFAPMTRRVSDRRPSQPTR